MPPMNPFDYKAGHIQKTDGNYPKPGKRKRRKKSIDYWPDSPFNAAAEEELLWRAVVIQAVLDAVGESRKDEFEHSRREARKWLVSGSEDFVDVCLRAGLDPVHVRSASKKALVHPRFWRTEAGESYRYARRKEARARRKQERQASQQEVPVPQGAVIITMFHSKKEFV